MQTSAPELLDLAGETSATLHMYGISDVKQPSFARNCLLARRLVERDVRFIQLFHGDWDHFSIVEPFAVAHSDDFAFVRFLLRRIGDDDAVAGSFFFVDALHYNAVV